MPWFGAPQKDNKTIPYYINQEVMMRANNNFRAQYKEVNKSRTIVDTNSKTREKKIVAICERSVWNVKIKNEKMK